MGGLVSIVSYSRPSLMIIAAFNQEKALVGAFSVIVQLHRLIDLRRYSGHLDPRICENFVKLRSRLRPKQKT